MPTSHRTSRPAPTALVRAGIVLLLALGLGLAGASSSQAGGKPSITKEPYGSVGGRAVDRWTLTNGKFRVRILTYGGILQTVETPDRHGKLANITLGFATLDGYVTSKNPAYFGALIGRYGNRIAKGKFTLDGRTYQLPINNDPNSLHGGTTGFDKRVWTAAPVPDGLRLTYVSKDGEEGDAWTPR
ncbi:hypothetical protein [Paractinoplanes lichenicola]|uniref:aldose epimerase family protein n=1 Tax=Paractinoplanes lichenicola TaxID=2802976 RepID=UPI001F4264EA|nr:hypothetical protein [Actinoplanes lichenicola]